MTVPAGLATRRTSMKIRYNGPLVAPIAKGQEVAAAGDHHRRHAAADRSAGRRRGCRPAPASSVASGSASSRCSGWRDRQAAGSSASKAGRGSANRPRSSALADALERARHRCRRHARAGRQRRRREDPRAAADGADERWERRSRSLAVRRGAGRPCREDHPAGARSRATGCCAIASSTARSLIRAGRGARASRRCERSTLLAIGERFP